MNGFIRKLFAASLLSGLTLLLSGCGADANFKAEQKIDHQGRDYAILSWNIGNGNNLIAKKAVLEPGFGEVKFSDQIRVQPQQTTTYKLTVHAEYANGGIFNTTLKRTVYVGPRVNYEFFTDNHLRACAKSTGFTHLEQFKALVCTEKKITSLQGIGQLQALQIATLDLNGINDLSALSGLHKLQTLSVSNNQLSSLASLPSLPKLTNLIAFNNRLNSVAPLAENPQLLNLAVNDNRFTDATSFTYLPNLTSLSIANNKIKDISPLAQLTKLRALNAKNNGLTKGVKDLGALKSALLLNLQNNPKVKCYEYAQLILALGAKGVLANGCSVF